MKTLLTIYVTLACSVLFAQDTTYTEWQTIDTIPRISKDTAQWLTGSFISISDSVQIQHRKGMTGVLQQRKRYIK